MLNFKEQCTYHLQFLDNYIKQAEHTLASAPAGILRISRSHNSLQYYCRADSHDKSGRYLKKSDFEFVQALAQKKYANDFLVLARAHYRQTSQLLHDADIQQLMTLHQTYSLPFQNLITPFFLDDLTYVKKWRAHLQAQKDKAPQMKNPISDSARFFTTERGELVRSKSEKILADKFFSLGIPYFYEAPLSLKKYGTIFPDFTLLNIKTKQQYYWEHFGMMDYMGYVDKSIKKIHAYEMNEIYPGQHLLLTYESYQLPLNMKVVENLIRHYF